MGISQEDGALMNGVSGPQGAGRPELSPPQSRELPRTGGRTLRASVYSTCSWACGPRTESSSYVGCSSMVLLLQLKLTSTRMAHIRSPKLPHASPRHHLTSPRTPQASPPPRAAAGPAGTTHALRVELFPVVWVRLS